MLFKFLWKIEIELLHQHSIHTLLYCVLVLGIVGSSLSEGSVYKCTVYEDSGCVFENVTIKSLADVEQTSFLSDDYDEQIIAITESEVAILPKRLISTFVFLELFRGDDNKIESIEDGAFADGGKIKILILNKNKISYLKNDVFAGAVALEALDVSNNSIKVIEENLFSESQNLLEIFMSDNAIEILPSKLFLGLNKLKIIELNSNKISVINAHQFGDCVSLTKLNLGDNNIETIAENAFAGLMHLEKLILSDNLIKTLPSRVFFGLPRLDVLTLSDNQISEINDDHFEDLFVTQIYLGNNKISNAKNLTKLKKLGRLNLQGNDNVTLPFTLFFSSTRLEILRQKVGSGFTFENGKEHLKIDIKNNSLNIMFFDNFPNVEINRPSMQDEFSLEFEVDSVEKIWADITIIPVAEEDWVCDKLLKMIDEYGAKNWIYFTGPELGCEVE